MLRLYGMRKLIVSLLLLLIPAGYLSLNSSENRQSPDTDPFVLYKEMGLNNVVNYTAFRQAVEGFSRIGDLKKNILTLIDFSKPSTEERLFVFDLALHKILFRSHVAHGQGSGGNYATTFSNVNGSHCSSLGFYLTSDTYQGGNGYSLRLDGLEKGINDKARERAIVIHAAPYCDPATIPQRGRLGRSFGCPALPQAVNREVIDAIKGGSLLYIYAADSTYLNHSTILGQ